MPFYRLDGGGFAHFNFGGKAGPAPCVGPLVEGDDPSKFGGKCGRPSVALCDWVVGKTLDQKPATCDAPVCDRHRTRVGPNVDHCWRHGQQQLPATTPEHTGINAVAAELRRRMKETGPHTCEFGKGRVMTTADWLAKHRDHGDLTEEPFPHPSGTWRNLVCSCGAKHLTDGQT